MRDVVIPVALSAIAMVALFQEPFRTLLRDWWNDPEAGHGLLLGPLAVFLGVRQGLLDRVRPMPILGIAIVVAAVLLRFVSGLAAELFTMRMSMLFAVAGLVVYRWGPRQLSSWWLPASLLVLSVPLPDVILSTLALPLQLQASAFGAALLESRNVPVLLSGNVIHIPGQSLFVTEACSGLRSLTALLSLGILLGGLWLKSPLSRVVVVVAAVPVAMFLNGVRIFLTGFLVYFVDSGLGEGVMHYTEGWVLFVVAFAILGALTWVVATSEGAILRRVGAS